MANKTTKLVRYASKEEPELPEADSTSQRVVKGFVVPKRGPLFEAELRREAELAIGRIWSCVKAELSLTEAAELFVELFAPFKIPKGHGRPRSSKSKDERLLILSDVFSRRKIALRLAGTRGWPEEPDAIEQRIQRLRREWKAKRPVKKKLSPKPLKNK